jgi:hypothetical protein
MHIDFLVEERSAEEVLQAILPAILGGKATHRILVFRGKQDLLKKLPTRLRGYRLRIKNNKEDLRIVVLVDQDCDDCRDLKDRLERIAKDFGFITKSATRQGEAVRVVNRIAIEEIEAWFFGDIPALQKVYPKLPATMGNRAKYRDPDTVHRTWESLHRELQRAGYDMPTYPKIEVARRVARCMDIGNNRSRSFNLFKRSVEWLIEANSS